MPNAHHSHSFIFSPPSPFFFYTMKKKESNGQRQSEGDFVNVDVMMMCIFQGKKWAQPKGNSTGKTWIWKIINREKGSTYIKDHFLKFDDFNSQP
jgi:hypothetical protein